MEVIAIIFLMLALSLIILTKNMVYAVFGLLAVMLCLVILYVFLGADFVATAQLMIYVGGILVLMIMGVMLAPRNAQKNLIPVSKQRSLGAAWITLSLGSIFLKETLSLRLPVEAKVLQPTTEKIGITLLTDYVIAFEIAGMLLLVALVGASSIAGKKEKIID
ncbi:MAG: NADH-quinone oxidoreductase subunit J [Raineya sp.]|nr:NADH-quinone oxidoreductase subunit J [Raineya sp.]MDW8296123.1 NADH-quinone oxidoreductase subunit J [Raineya sp.]